MTPKEALDKIKMLFDNAPAVPQMTDYKTQDGKTISCEGELKQGSKCAMKAADGSASQLPDGDYSLEDGTVITVVSGAITNVVPPAAPEMEMADAEPETEKRIAALETALKDIQSKMTSAGMSAEEKTAFDSLKAENETLKSSLEAVKNQLSTFSATVKEGFKLVEAIAETPAAKEEKPKNNFAPDKDKLDSKFKAMGDVIKTLNQN